MVYDNYNITSCDTIFIQFYSQCTVHDDHYGPMPDSIKQYVFVTLAILNLNVISISISIVHRLYLTPAPPVTHNFFRSIGQEYEEILKHKLAELKIWFVDEGILRQQGYDKVRIKIHITLSHFYNSTIHEQLH